MTEELKHLDVIEVVRIESHNIWGIEVGDQHTINRVGDGDSVSVFMSPYNAWLKKSDVKKVSVMSQEEQYIKEHQLTIPMEGETLEDLLSQYTKTVENTATANIAEIEARKRYLDMKKDLSDE